MGRLRKNGRKQLSKNRLRSAISHGRYLFDDIDHRIAPMRRLADLNSAHEADLAHDATHGEMLLVRRASVITALLETMEREFALEEMKVERPDQYTRYLHGVGMLNRILQTLGLQRRTRDVTPDLQTYLRENYSRGADDDHEAAE